MSIVVGGEYLVFASSKKSFIEELVYGKGSFENKDYVSVTVSETMRNGSYIIRPQNEEEVEMLEGSAYADDDEIFEFQSFEDVEFQESYDGCGIDYETEGMGEEEEEELLEELYDSEDWPDEFFSKKGFEEVDSRSYIIGAVDIESV
jgi:hypothetical protein